MNYTSLEKQESDLKNLLFSFMFNLLISHGGDGDVAYVGMNWKENVELFKRWIIDNKKDLVFNGEKNEIFTFYRDQECIYFAKNGTVFPNWVDVIETDVI